MIDGFESYKLLALTLQNGQYFWDLRNEEPMMQLGPAVVQLTLVLRLWGQLI